MAIFTIKLGLNDEYTDLFNELLKWASIIIIFHVLMNQQYGNRGIGGACCFSGEMFNPKFSHMMSFALLGLVAYELIIRKVVEIQ